MNKNIARPLIVQFTPPENNPVMKKTQKSYFVPVNTPWAEFNRVLLPLVGNQEYDSVLVHVTDNVDRDMKGVIGNMSIKLNAISGIASKAGKPVLTYEAVDRPFYLANPSKNDMEAAGIYAPSDELIMIKYNSYKSDEAWQEHQDKIWNRMRDMMPLSRKADKWNYDHAAQLKDPKRGLSDKELDKFWTFKPRQGLSPTVMGDDMIGMPSVEGREYAGFTMSNSQPDGSVVTKPIVVRSLMTTGASGIAIPMANACGHVNKHQIAADMSAWNTVLHFRAADGITVEKGQLLDKNTKEYNFNFANGEPTHLKVSEVEKDGTITMQDARGLFSIKPKKEIIDVLKGREYDVPAIITSVKAEQNGKYMWQSPGTMTGSEEVLKTVSPSNPGYIIARAPKNGADDYVVLIAEGALKGHIVAKYADVKDKEGVCFGDRIAGNRGIIVTQVPGVSEAYIQSALTIYDKYKIKGTYIAMDADGRENRNVANGIHTAYKCVNAVNPATVLSWDPAQKGMDDALLAVAQGKITIKEMGITSGTPEVLFPIEKARVMLPYKLDGSREDKPSWQIEYEESKKVRQEKVAAAQADTAARVQQSTQQQPAQQQPAQQQPAQQQPAQQQPAQQQPAQQQPAQQQPLQQQPLQQQPLQQQPLQQQPVQQQPVQQAPSKAGWVQTPSDISTIKSITVAKAAEMADAKSGKVAPPKVEQRPVITPDIDEVIDEEDEYEQEQPIAERAVEVRTNAEALATARRWDMQNPPMTPANLPQGCKSVYKYQQPVVEAPNIGPSYSSVERMAGMECEMQDGWGIVTVNTGYVMTPQEKGERQQVLKDAGLTPIGNMRLMEQTLTLDKDAEQAKNITAGMTQ